MNGCQRTAVFSGGLFYVTTLRSEESFSFILLKEVRESCESMRRGKSVKIHDKGQTLIPEHRN